MPDIFGIDITLIPWPMFVLLAVVGGFYVWYINVFKPLAESYNKLKEIESKNIEEVRNQMKELTESISHIKTDILASNNNQVRIIEVLRDIDHYSTDLHDFVVNVKATESHHEIRNQKFDETMKDVIDTLDDLKEKVNKKSKI
jgi:uncharacterized membrane protein YhiD involved in acid resistance